MRTYAIDVSGFMEYMEYDEGECVGWSFGVNTALFEYHGGGEELWSVGYYMHVMVF